MIMPALKKTIIKVHLDTADLGMCHNLLRGFRKDFKTDLNDNVEALLLFLMRQEYMAKVSFEQRRKEEKEDNHV